VRARDLGTKRKPAVISPRIRVMSLVSLAGQPILSRSERNAVRECLTERARYEWAQHMDMRFTSVEAFWSRLDEWDAFTSTRER
jgi:hypothetical protein